jgi:thioredoxin-like negative regulator of GroEL
VTRRGRPCTVCRHPDVAKIDRALVAGGTAGDIAAQFGTIHPEAVSHHRASHLPATLAKAAEAKEIASADVLLERVETIYQRAWSLLEQAEAAGDLKTALQGIGQLRGTLELLAKLMGELRDSTTVTVTLATNPEWLAVRTVIFRTLEPFPDARLSLAAALDAHDGA